MMNLLSKYYMMINMRNKSLYNILNHKKNIKFVDDIAEQTFKKAIKICFHDFSTIIETLLTRAEVEFLVDAYKNNLADHFNFIMIMLSFEKNPSV